MTVSHKLFKILSGHDVVNGRTDGQTDGRTDGRTDERHTIIRPKFHFGRIKIQTLVEYLGKRIIDVQLTFLYQVKVSLYLSCVLS